MNKQIFDNDGKLWVIHRAIHRSKMVPPKGIKGDDVNKMVSIWVGWLRDNNKDIQKVWMQHDNFLFCEEIETKEEIINVPRKKKRSNRV
tara:strand:- start:3674 stop:3940 length:267 start_codon:yes stop_codon:yes gene_type:complete